ncbi:TPA: AAA family ATPase [Candidatus Dojkabacteria bacterium]|jgi:adenylate kinase|uniref:Adenylate kinase n=1 Tax=Candidatus Dojkabacteria bacterium TaxID=2099670 RepID=A0A832QEP5_9BACT|nr:AAA family ATPase [Candidatus Dojkabacteria bacterium]
MEVTSDARTILFHGPSGCGKDTQVELLVDDYGFQNIGTGDMIRKLFAEGDEDAILATEYTTQGKFVPNEIIYNKMFPKWLDRFDNTKHWALVSVVREVGQIEYLDKLLQQKNRKLDMFIHFTLSPETAIERMSVRTYCPSCGMTFHPKFKKEKVQGICDKCNTKLIQRDDDKPEKIKERLREYNRTIEPILDTYRTRGILVEVDAAPSIEDIHKEILEILGL